VTIKFIQYLIKQSKEFKQNNLMIGERLKMV